MRVLCEALFTRRRFVLGFRNRETMGVRGWLAVQVVALAMLVCPDLAELGDE